MAEVPDLRESHNCDNHKEEVQNEVAQDSIEEEPVCLCYLRRDNRKWVLRPREEQRMPSSDSICSLCLLDCKTEEWSLALVQETKARNCVGVVVLSTAELLPWVVAAANSNGPEVIGIKLVSTLHDRCYTVFLKVLEAHRLAQL
eukprot:CAMPEP_0197656528 /NCGR_PEP_ID=MMETSP1338-20131121/42267_1 /TAXON_ID=43686 ORGANISM="Pelagodinium beii, Strain RCC1491" /NCGR_SAMPLE_ID=MMETSP1338 /ASSEMBLY_ACC=CAM_ASM_000754 /LENGTH=143 /DNA_ID=CAMNT_0043232569 /DNA_START=41 /DNA_END=472 /DNA_ORIENTATION=-